MYPVVRMTKEILRARRLGPIDLFATHESHHLCWPWDLDVWMELNNGRTLTILDLGRIPFFRRTGFADTVLKSGRFFTVAGSSVRYRRRITVFDRLRITTRLLGWDDRFVYVHQGIWKGTEATTSGLFRLAIADKGGIVPPAAIAAEMGKKASPPLPEWVRDWAQADAKQPWPPQEN